MRKRSICVCGYEGRSDYVKNTHEPNCKAKFKIENLETELITLKTQFQIETNKLKTTIQTKDNKIQTLFENLQHANENIIKLTKQQKTTHTINNVVNINVSPFGFEPDLDRLEVISLLKNPCNSIPKYIELKHFQKGNQNIKIQNLRSSQIQVVEDGEHGKKWVYKDKLTTLTHLVDINLDELIDKYSADTICKAWKIWYEGNNLNKNGYENTPEFKRIVKEVECILLNSRNT